MANPASNVFTPPVLNSVIMTGLNNNGNDCFINSAMQCLAASPFIHEFIQNYKTDDIQLMNIINKYNLGKIEPKHMKHTIIQILLNNTNIISDDKKILTHFCNHSDDIFIYLCVKNIINNLHSRTNNITNCNNLISVAREITVGSEINNLFTGEQNDPHELMVFLLDKLHNSKSSEANINLPNNFNTLEPYLKLYITHLKSTFSHNSSLFVKNFYYYMLNTINCNMCHKQSHDVSNNDIMCVSIPTQKLNNTTSNDTQISIEDCINDMFKLEYIEYTCEHCGNKLNNSSYKKIITTPKILIIKIKRYFQIGNNLCKNNKFITYPETLDISQHITTKNTNYSLYGVINHVGTMNSGHYYTYIKKYNIDAEKLIFSNDWYICNDRTISEISLSDVLVSKNAYMLFYYSNE